MERELTLEEKMRLAERELDQAVGALQAAYAAVQASTQQVEAAALRFARIEAVLARLKEEKDSCLAPPERIEKLERREAKGKLG
jgi:hypothetical protein